MRIGVQTNVNPSTIQRRIFVTNLSIYRYDNDLGSDLVPKTMKSKLILKKI